MPLGPQVSEPITGSDDAIRAAVADAELPPLLAALAQVTGDPAMRPDGLRPPTINRLVPQGGYSEQQCAAARELAAEALIALRDRRITARPPGGAESVEKGRPPETERLLETVRFLVGESAERYLPLLMDEIAVGTDPAAPRWRKEAVAPDRPFRVLIVGAGMSGLVAAYRLAQAGVPYTIIEKNDDIGGTWLENSYPGCRVDVSNHLYSYSFWPRDDWPQYFSTGDVLLDYFRAFAAENGIREHVRLGTEVVEARFAEDTCTWMVQVRGRDGAPELIEAQAVISAVGQLNRPSYPAIEGRADFAGPSFHSARWDHAADLRGQRVAVIGTGASAFQFVPEIAAQAGRVVIFQRTPPWLGPTPNYHDQVDDGMQWLLTHLPGYAQWYRFWLFCSSVEGMLPSVEVDPGWPTSERAVSAANDARRGELTAYLEYLFADRPDLLQAAVPGYPPGAKRMLRDNGVWAAALRRDNVELVTEPIERITERGVATAGGEHEADVLIYATGFTASDFLVPMRITGRGGTELHERWAGDARAYLGITVPGFPNLFCMYGPNTNIVVNGSIIFFSECEAHYIAGCIGELLAGGHRALDCRAEVHDAYNVKIDAANRQRAWGVSAVSTWYKNALGRVSQSWPFTLMEYWELTRAPDLDDYELL